MMYMLYGLVVCGGKSTRMGTDKSLLNYHGKPQREHLFEMLSSICEETYLSCNREQYPTIHPQYNPLQDDEDLGDIGPMAGVLTAFRRFPAVSFLVVGCDYPSLHTQDLQDLVSAYWEVGNSVAYYNFEARTVEPLLAVYHLYIADYLINNFKTEKYSLRSVLEEVSANKLLPFSPERLKSIDTSAEYRAWKDR